MLRERENGGENATLQEIKLGKNELEKKDAEMEAVLTCFIP